MLISFEVIHLYIFLAILILVLIGLWIKGSSITYLFFCALFGIYLIGVASVVVFPIHIPEKNMNLNYHLQVNLVLFNFGRCDFLSLCLSTIYENILLTIPLGFGINFIKPLKAKNMIWLALLVGLMLELAQLVISMVVQSSFRIVDINDVLLNAIGVLLGYGLFRVFGRLYLHLTQRFEINSKPVFSYIYYIVLQSNHP